MTNIAYDMNHAFCLWFWLLNVETRPAYSSLHEHHYVIVYCQEQNYKAITVKTNKAAYCPVTMFLALPW